MSPMPEALALGDAYARRCAASTFDRNVVVTASAGTGKTTLLVDRLLQLLMKSPHPVCLPEIVALTFMEKAAYEMKARLRGRLLDLLSDAATCGELVATNGVSNDDIRARAQRALQEVERSQIGTIHSFAAHLIRTYPIEAGVDPRFEADDGRGFEQHFDRDWQQWLNVELGPRGSQHESWKRILRRASLESLRELAKRLANDLVPLHLVMAQLAPGPLSPVVRTWLETCRERAQGLIAGEREGEKPPRQVERLLTAAEYLFDYVLTCGVEAVQEGDAELITLLQEKQPGQKPPNEWSETEFEKAVSLIDTAKALLKTDHGYLKTVLTVLIPFAERCRRRFLEAGLVGFDGLLARARDLLKQHPEVRRRLKQQFKAILVDEFQDTDPVQYEILLFLSERLEDAAGRWQEVNLEPGKLFIVGDPKQSIFAFRRADIEAFQHVTERVVSQGGMALTLTTNFRSHASILAAVNGLFARLIAEQPGLQPPYHALEAQPDRNTGAGTQGVELRLVAQDEESGEGEDLSAEQAVRGEAEAIARWMKYELIGKEVLIDAEGQRRKVEPGDVAMLFRTFSQGREYLDALRRYGLAYVAEGERHFYRRQEVVDFVNLLRCILNPDDAIARLGLLRSSLGALTDREIMELTELGALDFRPGSHANWDRHPRADHLQRLYAVLQSLREECPQRPLPEAVDLIFERLPVLELAAASVHGEQAVANLWKLRALTEDLVADPALTLGGLSELLMERVADAPEESESGLAEESSEAISVLTIHKAKGLEFPIVVLVGLHVGTLPQPNPIDVHHDWSTDVVGLRFEGISTLEGVFTAQKLKARMTAERRRLLYVGMTRAKERLILSGAVSRRRGSGNFLDLYREAIGESVGQQAAPLLSAGDGRIIQTIIPADEGKLQHGKPKEQPDETVPELADFALRWQKRERDYELRHANPIVVTPTSFVLKTRPLESLSLRNTSAMLLGLLVHSSFKMMSYGNEHQPIHDVIDRVLTRELAPEFQSEREAIREEIGGILSAFMKSGAYAELCAATILAREVPFVMPFGSQVSTLPRGLMEGRIDLVYRKDGRLWVADYKSDRVTESEISTRAETYREQARYYMQAVRLGFGEEPAGFKLIFVRLGITVPVEI